MKITRVATVLEFNAIAGLVKNSKRFIKLTPAGSNGARGLRN